MNLNALFKISYGLYVVCSKREKFNGMIANAVFQATAEPQTIAISINKQNLTHEFINESGVFTISVLSKDTPLSFIGQFGFKSGRDTDKFKDVRYKSGITGAPIVLDNTVSYFEANVINSFDAGTHTIFLGKVISAEIIEEDKEPITYAYYREIKGGRSPKAAPTYIKEHAEDKTNKYICSICGYVYNPLVGDSSSNVKPGTPFEELPDNWVCPVCGAAKNLFQLENGI